MQHRFRLLPLALLVAAVPAAAQVTVNPKALEPLGGAAPARGGSTSAEHAKHAPVHQHRAASRHEAPAKTAQQPSTKPAAPAAAPPRSLVHEPPVVPPAPPPAPVLAPLERPPPKHESPPTEPTPVVAGAVGEALPIADGLRLTFGAGSADLNPVTDAALQKLAHETARKPETIVTIKAYAAGAEDDPSTPRRLSLSRALAARSVLISEGIASTRIYVRALGGTAEGGPADRVDVTVGGFAGRPAQ